MKLSVESITDWRGHEIKAGSVVVYPQRQSSSMWMVEAVVEKIHPIEKFSGTSWVELHVRLIRTSRGDEWKSVTGKRSILTVLERVTVVA